MIPKDLDELIVIPMLTRVWPVATQRDVAITECVPRSFRLIPHTRVVLASVKDVGSARR